MPTASPQLLDSVRIACRRAGFALSTERTYTDWAKRLVLFHRRRTGRFVHPRHLDDHDVAAFVNYLVLERDVSATTQRQALCALGFLFRVVLERPLGTLDLKRPRRNRRLPTVLSALSVRRRSAARPAARAGRALLPLAVWVRPPAARSPAAARPRRRL
jgi:hypothetical protein